MTPLASPIKQLDGKTDGEHVATSPWPRVDDTAAMRAFARCVEVRESSIVGAGDGVWAAQRLPARRVLAWYRGARMSAAQVSSLYGAGRESCAASVLRLGPDLFVDGSDARWNNWTSKVNDARGETLARTNNCVLTPRGQLKTLREICPGEELFVSYGEEYWDNSAEPRVRHESAASLARPDGAV